MSDTLLQYLREARATEAGLTQTLKVHVAATPFGEHRARLEAHLEETRSHERRLAERLTELEQDGEDPLRQALSLMGGPVGFGLGIARGAARAMLSLVGLPMSLFREPEARGADRVLRNVRAETASEALEIATYVAIEQLAGAEGDDTTARLAAEIRADEEGMFEYLQRAVVELSAALAGKRAEPEPIPVTDEHSGDGAPPKPPARPAPVSEEAQRVSEEAQPLSEEPVHVSEEPELVAETAEPGAEEPAGAEVQVAEPWEGYEHMKASEIEQRLADASDEVAAVVRLYEGSRRNRQTVIRAAERRLRKA